VRALLLDRTHHVLVTDRGLPEVAVDGPRLITAIEAHFARLGITLPHAAGSRHSADGGRDFAFVLDRVEPPEGHAWKPLREVSNDDAVWSLYVALMLGGYEPPVRTVDVWSFGDKPEMAAQLSHLVLHGQKRATMGWVDAAVRDGTPLAYAGGVSVVTDGFGFPRCVLRSTDVREYAFRDVPPASAAAEGEGDLTYEDWREGHVAYFTREAARLGLTFDDGARISVEQFEVLWP
jgi:uncharacterized protein YhfF